MYIRGEFAGTSHNFAAVV